MSDLHEARVEAGMRACVLSPEIPTGQRAHLIHPDGVLTIRELVDLDVVVEKILDAADAVVTVEMIARVLADHRYSSILGVCACENDYDDSFDEAASHAAHQARVVLALLRGGDWRCRDCSRPAPARDMLCRNCLAKSEVGG